MVRSKRRQRHQDVSQTLLLSDSSHGKAKHLEAVLLLGIYLLCVICSLLLFLDRKKKSTFVKLETLSP